MVPITRFDEHLYPVPKFDLVKSDIKNFMNELKGFHEQFYDCFHRSESREHFLKFMAGQFSPLERKSIEPIALAVKDGNVRAMQRFVSDAPWADDNIIQKYRSLVNNEENTLTFRYVLADSIYGISPDFIAAVDASDDPQYSYFISNASSSTRLKTLVWLSGLRWAIEQCFEEAKSELGMDHYEVRKYKGWHHHMVTCILAHFFLWHLKIRMGKKSTVYYAVAA